MKRLMDIIISGAGLIAASPLLVPILFLVWIEGRGASPFYVASRVGKNGELFSMSKIRSMTPNADKSGLFSTAATDNRITPIGHFIRRYKIDELSQLWNVFVGTMSLVGPRPNVESDVSLYTAEEKGLLSVLPGITDFSSIVFSDEGDILKDYSDADLAYNQLIRPWKSRLGLLYIDNISMLLDLQLIILTAVAIVSKETALTRIDKILGKLDAPDDLRQVARRQNTLVPYPPPGTDKIFAGR